MSSRQLKVYDFDKTIYKGDSMVDFYLFNLRHDLKLLRFLPVQIWHIVRFLFGRESRDTVKQNFFKYLRGINDVTDRVEQFWATHFGRMQPWYVNKASSMDVIVTASPEFLIAPVAAKLGIELIATGMNAQTGQLTGKNCRGEEKVRRLKKRFPGAEIIEAYGDSKADMPMLRLARRAYVVSGSKPIALQR